MVSERRVSIKPDSAKEARRVLIFWHDARSLPIHNAEDKGWERLPMDGGEHRRSSCLGLRKALLHCLDVSK